MPIPKAVLDQAVRVYLEEGATNREHFLNSMATARRSLEAGYKSADQSFDSKVDAIEKDRKNRKKTAKTDYSTDSRTEEGGDFAEYEHQKLEIDADCDEQIKTAEADRQKTYEKHERRFAERLATILTKNRKAENRRLDKLEAALPTSES